MCVGLGFFRFDALTEAIKAREGVVAYTREAFGDLLAGFGCAAASNKCALAGARFVEFGFELGKLLLEL